MYPISGWNCKAFCVVFQEIYAADKKFTRPPVPLVPPNINSGREIFIECYSMIMVFISSQKWQKDSAATTVEKYWQNSDRWTWCRFALAEKWENWKKRKRKDCKRATCGAICRKSPGDLSLKSWRSTKSWTFLLLSLVWKNTAIAQMVWGKKQ